EDGIRDRNVTGVQTCALPILHQRRGQTQVLREVFIHVPVGLVRDQVRNVGLRHTGLLEEGAHSRRDVLADEVAHAASIHPEVVLPACEGRLAGRYTTSTRRHPDEVAVGPRKAAVSVAAPILSATAAAVGGWGAS